MKKIICIHLLNDRSGSPFILSQAIDALQDFGMDLELYTSDTEGFLSDVKIKKHTIFYKRSNNKIIVLFNYILSQIILFFKLLKYKNDDVIFYINTMMPFGAALAAKVLKKDVIYHIHETSINPKLLKRFLLKIIKITSSYNIFVSKFLEKDLNINNIKSQIIYNSLPLDFTKKGYQHVYNYSGRMNILMICSLKEYKGVLEFLNIADKCLSNSNMRFELILNASQHEIDDYFDGIKMPSNISLFARQAELHDFYKNATIVMNLSNVNTWVETFGMTILEAMVYGIPCIVPPIGGPLELVEDGVNGYCISSVEVDKISNLLMYLEANRDVLRSLSEKSREKSYIFSQENFSKNLLRVINE